MVMQRGLMALIGKRFTERLPVAAAGGGTVGQLGGLANLGVGSNLGAMGSSPWMFAVIDRVASSVSAVEWRLVRKQRGGEEEEVFDDPLLDLWERPNPFMPREMFVETSEQHMSLVGEVFWLIVRGITEGEPPHNELWPIRPDRIRPIPDGPKYINGYEYRVGNLKIHLENEDVIFMKRPDPLNPYRGAGVVNTLMVDVGVERAAATYNRAFFQNDATPGGIIELEESIDDDDEFDEYVARWNRQHMGAANSHRVAVIEKGKWVETKFTQRDMQFTDMRKFNRDLFLGAFGVHPSIMGISENVNLANAHVAEEAFARHVVVPRLRRYRSGWNWQLLRVLSSDPMLRMEFVNPIPSDRAGDLDEAERGYAVGILTLNESRSRLGEGEVDGGDEFKAAPAPMLMAPAAPDDPEDDDEPTPPPTDGDDDNEDDETRSLASLRPYAGPPGGKAVVRHGLTRSHLSDGQDDMESAWERRLTAEVNALADYLTQFFTGDAVVESVVAGIPLHLYSKIEINDIEGYAWDWFVKYGDDVAEELAAQFAVALQQEIAAAMGPGEVQRLAAIYADQRGAALLKIDGDLSMVRATKARVNLLVARTIENGDSLGTLTKALKEDFAFSPDRAKMVARTETATALGQGGKAAAVQDNRNEKRWVTQGDELVSLEVCGPNESQGWIKLIDTFGSGHDVIPGHINCRCTIIYRTVEQVTVEEDAVTTNLIDIGHLVIVVGQEAHCRKGHRLPVGTKQVWQGEIGIYCRQCSTEYLVSIKE